MEEVIITSRRSGGCLKKAQNLTLKKLEELKGTNKRQVRNCAFEIDEEKMKDFDVCLSKVTKHARICDQNHKKTQQNHEKCQ